MLWMEVHIYSPYTARLHDISYNCDANVMYQHLAVHVHDMYIFHMDPMQTWFTNNPSE